MISISKILWEIFIQPLSMELVSREFRAGGSNVPVVTVAAG